MELSYDERTASKPPTPPDAATTADAVSRKAVPLSSVSFIPKFSFLKEKVQYKINRIIA